MGPLRHFRLSAVLLIGVLLFAGLARAGLPAPQLLPGQPVVVGQQVLLLWGPVPGAAGYVVYRNNERMERVSSNQYLGPLPPVSGQYRYEVSAVDGQGVEGERSEPGVVRVRVLTPVKNVVARPDPNARAVSLLWDRVEGAVIYNVYRAGPGQEPQLIASVREETYLDASAQAGVEYRYTVAARDVGGAEASPSPPVTAMLTATREEPKAATVFRALPTAEALVVETLAGQRLDQVSDLRTGPDGNLWIVTPKTRQIHVMSPAGTELGAFGPYSFAETGYAFLPQKLDFGPRGNLYVTDAINSVLACIGPTGTFLWARGILTPPPDRKDVWQDLRAHAQSLPPTPSSVLCLEEELWVTDQRFQLLYRFDYQGEFLGYVTEYSDQGRPQRLSGVGELLRLGPDRVLLTFPLAHRAAVVDRKFQLLREVGTSVKGYIGGFVGIHGASLLPQGRFLLTDPAVGSLQIFDAETGAYLYHLSGSQPRLDPDYHQRADLPQRKPNLAVQDREGKFWFYDAATRRLVARKQTGPVTPEPRP